jgi:ribosomal protein L32/RsiW-degrading membrane proteinase PrsW (M82 family)
MRTCPNCGQEVPTGNFCVRCGVPLTKSTQRSARFAVAPHEHRLLPAIVSSLFPHLPRSDMTHYRVAMGVGTAIVLALGVAGLFPLALAGAAILVPLLAALYLHDVNVYEDEPLLVIAFTLAWGAASGVALALLAHAIAPQGIDQLASGQEPSALLTVLLLPALELILAVAGPALVLLPHRRYNDVLDGVTFGAATAAALSATEVIVYGYRIFEHGLAPGGDVLPWIWRLLTIRLALPILAMAATGAACGALWLRFRAPEKDRNALGLLGHPVSALVLRGALLVAAAAGQRWLPVGAWFAMLLVLDALALVWLRLMLQLGLREESAELEIGAAVSCPNCGQPTPRHTFCMNCGISLRALPKARVTTAPAPARLLTRGRALGFATFLGIIAASAVVIALVAPARPQARCLRSSQCGVPPQLPAPLRNQQVWRSTRFGFALEYAPSEWKVRDQGPAGIDLASTVAPVELLVEGGQSADARALLRAKVANLRSNLLGFARDPDAADVILGSAIGYRAGAGGAYIGTIDSPQGVQDQVLLSVLASSANGVGVVATTVTDERSSSLRRQVYGLADNVLNSVTWPGES